MKFFYPGKILLLGVFLITAQLYAQNVGINTTGASPNASAILDLNTGNAGTMGFLPEQVALTANNVAAPIVLPPTGLIVYNTATAGIYPNNIIPGYYYWDGTQWQLMLTGSGSSTLAWTVMGNTGTSASTNFLGTTDANDMVIKANNNEGLRVTSVAGPALPKIGINDATPGSIGSAMLELKGTNASQYGPDVQYLTNADVYPVSQIMNWTHDNASISFDAYWDGPANQWRSAYSTAPSFQLVKWTSDFWIRYAATTPAGTGPLAWQPGFVMTGTGLVGLGTNLPQQNLSIMNGVNVDQSSQNNGLFDNGLGTGNGLSFGTNSGEGIADNRNSSAGFEQFGLQFYTGYILAMNISNMSSGTYKGQVAITNGLNVDQAGTNNGFIDNGLNTGNGLTFGIASGEGIASKRTAGGNIFGLDFYTGFVNHMSLTQTGNLGIGTTAPGQQLEVASATSTVRIDGIKAGNSYYSASIAPTVASSVMFANNTTGDVQALAPSATNGQVLTQTATGPAWQSVGSVSNVQVITASGTYTPSAGTKSILVKMIGGGGGGGGVAGTNHASSDFALAAGGGGAGGYCEYFVSSVAASYPVIIGAGGNGAAAGNNPGAAGGITVFNGAVTAGGGNGGSGCGAVAGISYTPGGTGGTAVGGTLNITGGTGGNGIILVNSGTPATSAGLGASSPLGSGGAAPYVINTSTAGTNGLGYGAAGSGANSTWTGGGDNGANIGGNGAAGVIIIYEYK